jgi:hypothetical protein
MFSFGAGLGLLVLAVYFVFFTESGWLKFIGGAFIILFFVLSVIDAFQSSDPGLHLVIPGLFAALIFTAYGISRISKGWP